VKSSITDITNAGKIAINPLTIKAISKTGKVAKARNNNSKGPCRHLISFLPPFFPKTQTAHCG